MWAEGMVEGREFGGSVGLAAPGCTITVRGSQARPGRGRMCAQALPLQLALCAHGSALPTHNNQTANQQPQKLLWQHCRLSAAAVVTGGSSVGRRGGSCSGIGCGSTGGSVSVCGNGSNGGGGSSGISGGSSSRVSGGGSSSGSSGGIGNAGGGGSSGGDTSGGDRGSSGMGGGQEQRSSGSSSSCSVRGSSSRGSGPKNVIF